MDRMNKDQHVASSDGDRDDGGVVGGGGGENLDNARSSRR